MSREARKGDVGVVEQMGLEAVFCCVVEMSNGTEAPSFAVDW